MKKYFVLLFVFSNTLLFAQPPFDDYTGDGTANNPYKLYTKKHLMDLGDSINNSWVPNFSTWHFNKHFRLMNDINEPLTESIGYVGFNGHFHGGGHKINVAIIHDPQINFFYVGSLFPTVTNGGSIDSVIVEGYINGASVGQIAGIAMAITNSGHVNYCINNATITSWSVGGIGAIALQNIGCTISNCINNGDITGVDKIGGIAGQNVGTITNCINTGKITATNSGSNLAGTGVYTGGIGGISGETLNGGQILNCVNSGTIIGQRNVGGITGYSWGIPFPYIPVEITNCINYGFVKGLYQVGGIVGIMSITNVTNCVNVGVVEGEEDTGSIVGKE